ncbi:snapalysin family zinc-dependent metalloprotease [Pedococcus bigeumensis]|uniref:Extracellular small neutral protease n=1 Tax=Pedococcus bigeumensis TaxID=433644 RepID=A0A502D0A1_9MICO|nr:snapalysin family zinc-dependent metalloprotease [Pedococcus bigeumensis]TPG18302.1 snapalysin family zinc-dependent metalloprotease [Pedococcus bigeumensis]
MSKARLTLIAASTAALAATTLAAAPASTDAAPTEHSWTQQSEQPGQARGSSYLPNQREKAQNARLQKNLDTAIAQAAKEQASGQRKPLAAAVTVYYDDSQAPSFDSLIDQGAAIWNSRVTNVRLVEGNSSNASLSYYEGTDPSGSYYYGDGHGSGYVFLDYDQANVYAPLRIVTHETGHALGLPDRYTQPCSKLMSGGGPGPSCTNPYPDSVEASEVDTLWRNGFAASGTFSKVG